MMRYIDILFSCALEAGRCAYVVLLMATFWMTEVIPVAVTALLPVVAFPWLGIMDTNDVCRNYLQVGYTSDQIQPYN